MHSPLFLFLEGIGGGEMIVIVVFILVFFGANKIPELARGLGKGIREFKDASSEIRSEFDKVGQTAQAPAPPPYQQPQPAPYAPPAPGPVFTDAPVQHHDTPLPGAPAVVGAPLTDSSVNPAPAYGAPAEPVRPRLDQSSPV